MSKDFRKFQGEIDKITTNVEGLGSLAIEIGLPDDRIHNPSGLTLAKLGAIHEFGLGNVPERSFLRGAVINGKAEIKEAFGIVAEQVTKGKNAVTAMSGLAQFGEALVKDYIADGIDPPKQLVVDGKTTPLINTGEMRQSIIGVVVSD